MERLPERNGGDVVDEHGETRRSDLLLGVALVRDVPDLRGVAFGGAHRLIDGLAENPGVPEGALGRSVGIVESGEFGPVHG